MKRSDIDKLFTQKVAYYFSEGYTIHSNTMGGSQGEVAKVDLVKGNTLLRVWLNNECVHDWEDLSGFHGDTMVLRVGTWNRSAKEATGRWSPTVWMSELTTIYEETFYLVKHNSNYYVSKEEAIAAQRIRKDRRRRRLSSPIEKVIEGEKAISAARSYLQRVLGYSRINNNDILVTHRLDDNQYIIQYRGHYCQLK